MKISRLINEFRFAPRSSVRKLWAKEKGSGFLIGPEEISQLNKFLSHSKTIFPATKTKTLLLTSYLPLPYSIKVECIIAKALEKEGYKVVVLMNNAVKALSRAYHSKLFAYETIQIEDFYTFKNSDKVDREIKALFKDGGDVGTIKAFRYRGAYLGMHALASLSSSMSDGRIELTGPNIGVLKRLLRKSMLLLDAADTVMDFIKPTLVLSVEKGFVGTCETFYSAITKNIDFVQWVNCHEPNSIMFKRYSLGNFRAHPFSISDSAWGRIKNSPWREEFKEEVMTAFRRGYQEGAWFKYKGLSSEQTFSERQDLIKRLDLDSGKKTAVIYSHILNDANLFYGEDLFLSGYEEWLVETIKAAKTNAMVNWVLKLHPANLYRNKNLGYSGEYGEIIALKKAFDAIPAFLKIVYPEEKISPLSFFNITDFGITVRGTVGLELPCFGIPVVTAGTGRYSNKGFTVDPGSVEEYLDTISNIHKLEPLKRDQVTKAALYAYFVFKKRPAKYDQLFSDVYKFPMGHSRYRDIQFERNSLADIMDHEQMTKMAIYLMDPSQEDFFASE